MGAPGSSAVIRFPASLIDSDIRKELDDYGVKFKEWWELDDPNRVEIEKVLYDLEAEIEEGIFRLYNGEAAYGEFVELELVLREKKIPFDRESHMDWDRPPCLVVYRPGEPGFNLWIPLDPETDEPVVSVKAIRELLATKSRCRGSNGEAAALAIEKYLYEHFPAYPPLEDFVKEKAA